MFNSLSITVRTTKEKEQSQFVSVHLYTKTALISFTTHQLSTGAILAEVAEVAGQLNQRRTEFPSVISQDNIPSHCITLQALMLSCLAIPNALCRQSFLLHHYDYYYMCNQQNTFVLSLPQIQPLCRSLPPLQILFSHFWFVSWRICIFCFLQGGL